MTRLAGKRAVVTGAGRGIGRAVAAAFAAEGADVTGAGRGKRPGDLAPAIGWARVDVADAAAVARMAAAPPTSS